MIETEEKARGFAAVKQKLEQRIAELEIDKCLLTDRIAELEAPKFHDELPESSGMEVWGWHPTKAIKEQGTPDRWRSFTNDGKNWEYREEMSFWSDNAYGSFVKDRLIAMVENAFSEGREIYVERVGPFLLDKNGKNTGVPSYSHLPKFDPHNRLSVIVKIEGRAREEEV